MTFVLGTRSVASLKMAAPALLMTVRAAILLSDVDFGVPDKCWRTLAEEKEHLANGTSHTLKSKHIIQADGFSHAADLVPFLQGGFTWSAPAAFYEIAEAMREAALKTGAPIVWGGQWDVPLAQLPPDAAGLEAAHNAYMKAFKARHGHWPFVDLPHFQLAA